MLKSKVLEGACILSCFVVIYLLSSNFTGAPVSENKESVMEFHFNDISKVDNAKDLVILIGKEKQLLAEAAQINKSSDNLIVESLEKDNNFKAKFGQVKELCYKSYNAIKRIFLLGTGDNADLKKEMVEKLGSMIGGIASRAKLDNLAVLVEGKVNGISSSEFGALLASGAEQSSYRFDKYNTENLEERHLHYQISFYLKEYNKAQQDFPYYQAINKGLFLARDLINEPGNELYPDSYAEIILKDLQNYDGISVEVMNESEMRTHNMGALIGVGQGSHRESKLVTIKYNGNAKDGDYIGLVGKGVTFDTGGISIKPSGGMETMKYDMAGSASIAGTMKTLADRKAKVNAVAVLALAENMPGSNAQRPGDIVKTMSGKTVEVLNTDAEGRLVLADALTYIQENYNPKLIIDLATLTGAIVVALGSTYAGCFSNNDKLSDNLIRAGSAVDEKVWRMPLHKEYTDMMKSDCADIANIGGVRGAAGSSTAAAFLEKFIDKDRVWAHLDIAGVAWNKKTGTGNQGPSGFGLRLLNQFIFDNYESNS